jgi:MFS family permease
MSFIAGIEFVGAFLIPFYKEWGGISQFQIQILQSWFMFWIFVLEVPTGMIGDNRGRKFSVLMGFILLTIGVITYSIIPNFTLFLIGEFILAAGIAFTSGADEALLYDTVIDMKLKSEYGKISNAYDNFKFFGMLFSSLIAGLFVYNFAYNIIFMSSAIFTSAAGLILYFFIKEPKYRKEKEEFKPDYIETFKEAYHEFRHNNSLLRLTLITTIINSTAYFSIWFYQILLERYNVAKEYYGLFRVYGLAIQIFVSSFMLFILKPKDNRLTSHSLLIVLIIVGFLAGGLIPNIVGVIIFITFVMGIGLKHRTVAGQFMNNKIESKNRATVLSFISMSRRVLLIFANPLMGYLADINLNYTLIGLGFFLLIPLIFIKLEPEDLSIE